MEKVKVNDKIEATVKYWEGYGKSKMYFSLYMAGRAGSKKYDKLCFDLDKREFTACANNYWVICTEWAQFKKELFAAFEIN